MSASELIEQVRRHFELLPPAERRRFWAQFATWEAERTARTLRCERSNSAVERCVRWPDPTERLRRIFGDRLHGENVVLAAREEEVF